MKDMIYARIAVNVPVQGTFDYHIQEGDTLEVGHLVRVSFGTAVQPGIVLELHDTPPMDSQGKPIVTKPVLEKLDPEPVVTPQQIKLAQWMSDYYLAPIGQCLWLMLPPGIAGYRDVLVTLLDDAAASDDPLEAKVLDALKRRGPLRGRQLLQSVKHKGWRRAVNALENRQVAATRSVLLPPAVKRKRIQVAALAIHPDRLPDTRRFLGKPSREADLLEAIERMTDEDGGPPLADDLLQLPNIGIATLDHLLATDYVRIDDSGAVYLITDDVDSALFHLRDGEVDLRVLRVLAREGAAVDVSWIYAQTGAKLADLKRLEARHFIQLGEKATWRDPLAERDFIPLAAPKLTDGQRAVWRVLRAALQDSAEDTPASTPHDQQVAPSPFTGRDGVGSEARRSERWYTSAELWAKLQPIAQEMRQEPTPAEKHLWQHLRNGQLGIKFRRQHAIDRFIVDFYCHEARLIVEVDGDIHQYQQNEDALRQAFLESLGFRVLRFDNEQVLQHIEDVIQYILMALQDPHPASPASGGGADTPASTPHDQQVAPPSAGRGWKSNTFLLHGVTGSGKTEIYLRAMETVLAQGRQALLLVPEIALTAQTVRRVMARFPGKVAVLGETGDEPGQIALVHSGLKPGERYDSWLRARAGEVQVVVGTRSALFTPLPDVGLVILDEEHDSSYKQSPPAVHSQVYYHTRQVAEKMMSMNGGVVILGSATPSVESYFQAQRGMIGYLHLPDRIMGHRVRITEQAEREGIRPRYVIEPSDSSDALSIELPPVNLVDMRLELKSGNTDMFSRDLQDGLRDVLARGEQAILFLNRRGTSTYVFCRDCGYVVLCPRCDTPLTYHQYDTRLHCHHCGHIQDSPATCPECRSTRIKFFGAGTQQVEAAFNAHFPQARALRWDADTAAQSSQHDLILQRFLSHQADVLIGTQMVAKGLDLPLVTLVGVVSADVGLNLPDFRAPERTFQLLTQVAGRAGRGLLGGRVILQTYQPDHYAVQAAAQHDYAAFYEREIGYRREMGYPPFRRLVRILFQGTQEYRVRDEALHAETRLRQRLDQLGMTGTSLIGPVPCFFGRLNRVYRWQILLRGPNPVQALHGMSIPSEWHVDVDPVDIL